jgi:hypothetical protein
MATSDEATDGEKHTRPHATRVRNAGGLKVWGEVYPGGDMMIELGGIGCDRELYLNSAEAESLQEVVNDLLDNTEDPAEEGAGE